MCAAGQSLTVALKYRLLSARRRRDSGAAPGARHRPPSPAWRCVYDRPPADPAVKDRPTDRRPTPGPVSRRCFPTLRLQPESSNESIEMIYSSVRRGGLSLTNRAATQMPPADHPKYGVLPGRFSPRRQRRAADQDPERVRAMLDRFYDAMAAEIERAGGTVEKFIRDAVMAVFGAPVAHEDDAERALHVALGMQRRLRELFGGRLALRIGVNTGDVVVGRPRRAATGLVPTGRDHGRAARGAARRGGGAADRRAARQRLSRPHTRAGYRTGGGETRSSSRS